MINQLLVSEMAATVERERMVEIARRGRIDEMARAGLVVGQQERARNVVSAFLQRMGRPRNRGSAPAGGDLPRLDQGAIDRMRPAASSLTTARL
jgi:hypothetical protein